MTPLSAAVAKRPPETSLNALGRIPVLATCVVLISCGEAAPAHPYPDVIELTISEAHEAMLAGELTARALVETYLARIEAFDRNGPAFNAIIAVNPGALARADSLDDHLERHGAFVGALHGVPVIVKDNYDTGDMPTTGGSASLLGSQPADDAFQVRRIREEGAIVLAKSNLAEFAFTAMETVGSAIPGWTFNPYRLNRVTAGSSGGTAAAVAANLGLVGLGTDTGNSIRGPAAHTALVGIRATQGLASRDGIIPLFAHRDVGGPMTRTVEDAARILDVIAGTDPSDPVTEMADARREASYLESLADSLVGVSVGVVGQIVHGESADDEVLALFERTLEELGDLGAEVVEGFEIPGLDSLRRGLYCPRFRHDLERYLSSLPDPRASTLAEIAAGGDVHVTVMPRVLSFLEFEGDPATDERCLTARANEDRLRRAVDDAMTAWGVDVVVYPTWNNPPRLVGDLSTPHGNNSPILSPPTGYPAVTVPMGYTRGGTLPAGLQILGPAWSESLLVRVAYAYEQATRHRRPPATAPRLTGSRAASADGAAAGEGR